MNEWTTRSYEDISARPRSNAPGSRGSQGPTAEGQHIFLPLSRGSASNSQHGYRPITVSEPFTQSSQYAESARIRTAPEGAPMGPHTFKNGDSHDPLDTHMRNHIRESRKRHKDIEDAFNEVLEGNENILRSNEELTKAIEVASNDQEKIKDALQTVAIAQEALHEDLSHLQEIATTNLDETKACSAQMAKVLQQQFDLRASIESLKDTVARSEDARQIDRQDDRTWHTQLVTTVGAVRSSFDDGVERISNAVQKFAAQQHEDQQAMWQRLDRNGKEFEERQKQSHERQQHCIQDLQRVIHSLHTSKSVQPARDPRNASHSPLALAPRRTLAPSTRVAAAEEAAAVEQGGCMSKSPAYESDMDIRYTAQDQGQGREGGDTQMADGRLRAQGQSETENQRAFPVRPNDVEAETSFHFPSPLPPPPKAQRKKGGRKVAKVAPAKTYKGNSRKRQHLGEAEAETQERYTEASTSRTSTQKQDAKPPSSFQLVSEEPIDEQAHDDVSDMDNQPPPEPKKIPSQACKGRAAGNTGKRTRGSDDQEGRDYESGGKMKKITTANPSSVAQRNSRYPMRIRNKTSKFGS